MSSSGRTAAADEWRVEIDPLLAPSAQTGWATTAIVAGDEYTGLLNSAGVQNNEINWDVTLSAGTWLLDLWHRRGSDRGIYTVLLDGAAVATIDGYAATLGSHHDATAGFNVPTTGKHRITLRMATRNASATAWSGSIYKVGLVRTA